MAAPAGKALAESAPAHDFEPEGKGQQSAEEEYASLPKDYAADFPAGLDRESAQPSPSLFAEGSETGERDLDVPAFMRRNQF